MARSFVLRLLGWSALLSLLVLATPRIVLRDEQGAICYSFPVFLGDSFQLEYIHSVQLCPVVDIFTSHGGRLWLLEERTQSTNAGLPTEAPHGGYFLHETPWYRYIGGGKSFANVPLRVGTNKLGRNTMMLPSGENVPLYRLFTGKRMNVMLLPWGRSLWERL